MVRFGAFLDYDEVNRFLPGCGFHYLDVDCGLPNGIRPYDFLHGYCELFAIALHDRFGVEIRKAYANDRLVHAFCIAPNNLLLDVRGGTDCPAEFWKEFRYYLSGFREKEDYSSLDVRPVSLDWIDSCRAQNHALITTAKQIITNDWLDFPILSFLR